MSNRTMQTMRGVRRTGLAVFLGLAVGVLSGCDSLLESDLPHLLTDDAIDSPGSADLQMNSAIALFECGASAFGWMALGHEDVFESIAGVAGTAHVFRTQPVGGTCDQSSEDQSWFDQVMSARAMISGTNPTTGDPSGLYTRLQNDWDVNDVPNRERLMAVGAIYMAVTLAHFGEFVCEGAIDGGPMMSPDDFLADAEGWITNNALGHVAAVSGGDFEMPHGIANSAQDMAMALRARIRWARGNLAQAAADAAAVPDGFTAWITRDAGEQRRNKIFNAAPFSGMLGINDWWNPAIRNPNPATGTQWQDPIPFTGYLFVGVMPDGRTLEADNTPVRWAEEFRAFGDPPTPLANGAVEDTRVQHFKRTIQGPSPREVPAKYDADEDDIPMVSWREMRLIQAEHEHSLGNLQDAIDLVNTLRTAAGLPLISGGYETALLGDADMVRHMIIEEKRRELYAEGGRYWSTKIRNPDLLWFPRAEGSTPEGAYQLLGGVRMLFPDDEYQLNPNFEPLGGLDARGTGCPAVEAPIF